jgi:hypothetical protein
MFGHGGNLLSWRLSYKDPRHGNPFREKWLNMSAEEREDFLKNHQLFHARHPGKPPEGNAEK